MKRGLVPGILVVTLCAGSVPVWGQAVTASLKPAGVGSSTHAVAELAVRYAKARPGEPESTKGTPRPMTKWKNTTYDLSVGGANVAMMVQSSVFAWRLIVDTDCDGNLSNEKALPGSKRRASNVVFPAFGVKTPGGAKIAVRAELDNCGRLLAYPGRMMAGTVKLGERGYRIFLADGNLDGDYDDCGTGASACGSCDVLAIDMNANRKFDAAVDGCPEAMLLGKRVRVNGAYYSVTPSVDGTSIEMAPTTVETGTLDAGAPCADILLRSDNGTYRLCGGKKTCELPVGRYQPVDVRLVARDRKGATWVLPCTSAEKLGTVEIKAGQTTSLEMGTPLVAKVDIRPGDDKGTLSLGFDIYGRAGETYAPRAYRNGIAQPTPRFTIGDESGKVLSKGDFFKMTFG